MIDGATLSISGPNVITSSPSGGRFDFDDGGTYCGGWQDGKAHGHGVCTGPKNVGEYLGSWNFGFEMSGVYKWKNGAVYEGRWQNGKRHGVGVEYNGKWIYKGEWSQGFKGRYGVKMSSNSAVKYEGTWANGLQDGYGSETYSDGGYYQGQMCGGLRHGYGVRKSAPYGDSQLNNPNKNGIHITGLGMSTSMMIHSNSLQSGNSVDLEDDSPKPEDDFKPNIDRTLASKNGFVLVAKPLDVPMSSITTSSPSSSKYATSNSMNSSDNKSGARRSSLTGKLASARIPNQTASLLRGLGLKKQKSTSDLETLGGSRGNFGRRPNSAASSGRNNMESDLPVVPFTLSPEELDITDPTTVETYTGEWKHDKRNGHGVCERSDGLKYEGQWHNDMKCGYGVTTFKNGTKEEGKYKNNILITDSKVKRFFHLGGTNMRQRIDDAVKMAQQAQTMALKKAEIAETRAATARDKADQASTAALEAARDSQIAYSVARQYSNDSWAMQQQQLGLNVNQAAMMGLSNPNAAQMYMMNQQSQMMMPEPTLPNLGMTQSSLQMRRISQQQQRFNSNLQGDSLSQMNMIPDQQQAAMQKDQQRFQPVNLDQQPQQYLANVEPFNGRRGSFRGGGSQPSSGYQSAFAARNTQFNQTEPLSSTSSGYNQKVVRQSSADPFNDLFDHYKSSTGGSPGSSAAGRRMLSKQASLDYQHGMRQRNQTNPSGDVLGGSRRMRGSFRMSSMDHAEENQQQRAEEPNQQVAQDNSSQRQFKYLITSGEELNKEQQVDGTNQNEPNSLQPTHATALTPTSSSYILPHSGGSSFAGNQTTPSPDAQSSFRSPSSQYYAQRVAPQAPGYQASDASGFHGGQYPANPLNQHLMKQRDVHSLADEQLYMAGRRAFEHSTLLDRTEYTNYDFTISSSPRLSRRCMRRTASLSRNTPLRMKSDSADSALVSRNASRTRLQQESSSFVNPTSTTPTSIQTVVVGKNPHENVDFGANHVPDATHPATSNMSYMTLSSGSSTTLIRKPSLQVRYDPVELGGLMSREEVAALSHAQREQKRLEAEMAEKRAKHPFLHLYLSLKEFLIRQKLVLTVLMINIFLFKMFADLIV